MTKYISLQNLSTFWGKAKEWVNNTLKVYAKLDSPEFTGTPLAPTAVAGTNTQQIATTAFVKGAVETAVNGVKADLGSALTYKGSVDTYEQLPTSGQAKGDTYNVKGAHGNTPAGTNYAWDGSAWDPLGGDVDLSAYALTETVNGQISGLNTEIGKKVDSTTYGQDKAKLEGDIAKKLDASTYNTEKAGFLTEDDLEGYLTEDDLEAVSDGEIEALFS